MTTEYILSFLWQCLLYDRESILERTDGLKVIFSGRAV